MQELYDRYSKGLRRCVDRVYADGSDADLADRFRANVSRFAAYKADYVKVTVNNILNDSSIPLKQRQEMADAAVAGFDRYSEAECNTATSRCRTAKQWKEFNDPQRLRLFPNLRWLPSRSIEKRQSHIQFYDHVWSKGDDFWNHNTPGTEWNCKCDVEETDDPVTNNGNMDPVQVPAGLEGNPAVTREIFTDRASYIKKCTKDKYKINEIGRNWLRSIENTIDYEVSTKYGKIQVDKNSIDEIAQANINEKKYWQKIELSQDLQKYANDIEFINDEAVDLTHNKKGSKAYKRKKSFVKMKKYVLTTTDAKFIIKTGEYKNGDQKLYTMYQK